MLKIHRRLALWGGAAALAGSGFAFMASSGVSASNVGEGAAAVSGYHVYNIDYTGVPEVGNPDTTGASDYNSNTGHGLSSTGTMQYLGGPIVGGLAEQDGVQYVSFQLNPDNAHWASVQLYNSSGAVVGGGGASNCTEHTTTTQASGFFQGNGTEGFFNGSAGIWSCYIHSTAQSSVGAGHSVPASDISYIDVEAGQ